MTSGQFIEDSACRATASARSALMRAKRSWTEPASSSGPASAAAQARPRCADVERLEDAHHRLVRRGGGSTRGASTGAAAGRLYRALQPAAAGAAARPAGFDAVALRREREARWGHRRRRGRPRRARLDQRQLGARAVVRSASSSSTVPSGAAAARRAAESAASLASVSTTTARRGLVEGAPARRDTPRSVAPPCPQLFNLDRARLRRRTRSRAPAREARGLAPISRPRAFAAFEFLTAAAWAWRGSIPLQPRPRGGYCRRPSRLLGPLAITSRVAA